MADKTDLSAVPSETLDRLHDALSAERQKRGISEGPSPSTMTPFEFEQWKNALCAAGDAAARREASKPGKV